MESDGAKSESKEYVDVIHEKDLKDILIKLEIFESIQKNEVFCYICKNVINLENICAIFVKNGEIHIICGENHCYSEFLKLKEDEDD